MVEKSMESDFPDVHVPFKSTTDGTEARMDIEPPAYENPQLEFNSGWKDFGFAIAFWIHTIIVIILACVLGIPFVMSNMKQVSFKEPKAVPPNFDIKSIGMALGGAVAVSGFVSFVLLFILQLCAGYFIKCTFLIFVILLISLGVVLYFILPPLIMIPCVFLFFMLIFIACIRKRISFSEAHLQAGCASLRTHPSLILIAFFMLIVEFLWFIFWGLMCVGIFGVLNTNTTSTNLTVTSNEIDSTSAYATSAKLVWLTTATPAMKQKEETTANIPSWMQGTGRKKNASSSGFDKFMNSIEKKNSTSTGKTTSQLSWTHKIVTFLLLFSWYWGAITFGNIIHFIAACAVGDWWFVNDTGDGKYKMGNSLKRAFTKSLGTIAFGSLFEAIIKALRCFTKEEGRKNILACLVDCVLGIIEKVIGYMNEWAFTFAALTGQGFIQASKSFIELFKKRGWTAIINDSIVSMTLGLINLAVGLISAFTGGYLLYLFMAPSPEKIMTVIIIGFNSLIIGIFMSSIITTLIMSCVRSVFVCFALNPAALGATHPDHLQKLTKVWHKFYPQEFSNSGYANEFKDETV